MTEARLTPQALTLGFTGGARLEVLINPAARESLLLTQTDPEEGLILLRPL